LANSGYFPRLLRDIYASTLLVTTTSDDVQSALVRSLRTLRDGGNSALVQQLLAVSPASDELHRRLLIE
jgi:hypothetical protein